MMKILLQIFLIGQSINFYSLGLKFYEKGDYSKSVRYFEMAYNKKQSDATIRTIIDCYLKTEQFDKALEWADTMKQRNYCEGAALSGYLIGKIGKKQSVVDDYFDKLKVKCGHSPFPFYYHSLLVFESDTQKAFKLLGQAYKKDSLSVPINLTMGMFYYRLKDYKKAAGYFKVVYKKGLLKHEGILRIMADAFYRIDDQNTSMKLYKKLTDLDPDNKFYWNRLAKVYKDRGRVYKAIYAYKRSLKLDGKDHAIRLSLALTYIDAGNNDFAKRELLFLEKHCTRKNISGYVYYYLGFLTYKDAYRAFKNKEYKSAMKLFENCEFYLKNALTYNLPPRLIKEVRRELEDAKKGKKKSYRKYNRIE